MDKKGANNKNSSAYEYKRCLLEGTTLEAEGVKIPLLEDCTLCQGSGEGEPDHYGRRNCPACKDGLTPSDSGRAVIKFMEEFMETKGSFSLRGK